MTAYRLFSIKNIQATTPILFKNIVENS